MYLDCLNSVLREMYHDIMVVTVKDRERWNLEEDQGLFPAAIAAGFMFLDRNNEVNQVAVKFPKRPFFN